MIIKNFGSFINENYGNNKKIPVSFTYNGVDYDYILDTEGEGSDFWTSFYGKDIDGNDITFDVNYDEDYNMIAVYPVDMKSLETDYENSIINIPIFSDEEYKIKQNDKSDDYDSTEYYDDED